MKMAHKICMLSYSHHLLDDRIYWKEAVSLRKNGYTVVHIGLGNENKHWTSSEGIDLVQIKKTEYHSHRLLNRASEYFRTKENILDQLLSQAANEKADVYHLHDFQLNKIAGDLKKLPHKPIIINDVHDANVDLARSAIPHLPLAEKIAQYIYSLYIASIEKRFSGYYNAIITAEEYVASLYISKGISSENIHVIHNYSYFQPDEQLLQDKKDIYDFIYAGTISKTRGIFEIIRSVELIKERGRSIKGIIIGRFANDQLKDEVISLIQEKKLQSDIVIHDPVPFERMHEFYLKSRIGLCLLHLNKKYQKAIPIKIFEYMAFGLPVILSESEIADRYIKKEEAGLLVDPLDTEAIANVLVQLLDNKEIVEKLGRNGMEAVKKSYHWRFEETKLLELYKKLLRDRNTYAATLLHK